MKTITMTTKRTILVLTAMFAMTLTTSAMSYEQARNEALFLTDKMAYELNLTDAQYEAAYEINLDYLMGVTSVDDVYGSYWERRNLDLSYILYSWQWDAFRAASYFFRPLYWDAGYWHFGIYARYPRRDYFYFGRPHFYATYRGGHAWHINGGRSYYYGRASHFRPALPQGHQHIGLRNRFDRGDFRNLRTGSSTRITSQRGYNQNHNYGGNATGNFSRSSSNSNGNFGHSSANSHGNFSRSSSSSANHVSPSSSRSSSRSNSNGGGHFGRSQR